MGSGCHRNLFLSSCVVAWQEQPGHSINHFCHSWWWCIPSALSVHAIVCTLQIPRLIHLLPPHPAPRAPSTLLALSESTAHGWARREVGSPAGEADTHEFWQLGNREYFSVWTKLHLNTTIVVPFFFSSLRWHYIPFCLVFKRCRCNCWEEFLVLKFCWCMSHNRPFICETSEDTTFVLQFRY